MGGGGRDWAYLEVLLDLDRAHSDKPVDEGVDKDIDKDKDRSQNSFSTRGQISLSVYRVNVDRFFTLNTATIRRPLQPRHLVFSAARASRQGF